MKGKPLKEGEELLSEDHHEGGFNPYSPALMDRRFEYLSVEAANPGDKTHNLHVISEELLSVCGENWCVIEITFSQRGACTVGDPTGE